MTNAQPSDATEFGFPISLNQFKNPMQVIEDTLFMRACQLGILEIEVFDTDFSAQQGLRSDGLMPILVDYVTHVYGTKLQWNFDSSLQDQVMVEILENNQTELAIADLMSEVSARVNRPALFNQSNDKALLNSQTQLREVTGMPFSVTLMMMDMALETAYEMSQSYQQKLVDDPREDVLDLTPVVELLQRMDAQPRVEIPETLDEQRLSNSTAIDELTETLLSKHQPNNQQDQGD
jgi:hypothetical protein